MLLGESMLQSLSIEKTLNRKYRRPVKDMIQNVERTCRYLTINMTEKLEIDILPDNKWGVNIQEAKNLFTADGVSVLNSLIDKGLDECSVQTYWLYKQYLKGMKHYIPSNPLVSVLKEIDVDMKGSYLVPGTSGYFELSNTNIKAPSHWSKNSMENMIFYVTDKALMLGIQFKNDLSPTSFFIPINKEENLADCLFRMQFKTIKRDEFDFVKSEDKPIESEDIKALKLLFNLVIYVTNPNEEFKEEFNKFSSNQKVAQQEQQTYTTKPFIKLGFDAEFLRLITTESYDVRGHWRWQPVGVGRLGRKLTFIRPHQRSQSKYHVTSSV